MCAVVLHCAEGRGSVFSQESWGPRFGDSAMDRGKRLWRDADCRVVAAADSVQGIRFRGGSVRGAAVEFYIGNRAGTADPVFRCRIFGSALWQGCTADAGTQQADGSGWTGGICCAELS